MDCFAASLFNLCDSEVTGIKGTTTRDCPYQPFVVTIKIIIANFLRPNASQMLFYFHHDDIGGYPGEIRNEPIVETHYFFALAGQ